MCTPAGSRRATRGDGCDEGTDAQLTARTRFGHIGLMKRWSLAEVKAHLSALVNEAEHKGRRILILRHGKPSAALVPVDVALARGARRRRGRLSAKGVRDLLGGLGKGRVRPGAVADLLDGRR